MSLRPRGASSRRGWLARAAPARVVLTAVGIALAGAMLSAAVVVSYGLGTGFDRSARAASLPDIIVRFNNKSAADVAARIRALPDIARFSLRFELTGVGIGFHGRRRDDAVAEVLDSPGPRRGYAVVAGRNLGDRGCVGACSSGRSRTHGGSGWATRSTSRGSGRCAWSGSSRRPTTSATRSR